MIFVTKFDGRKEVFQKEKVVRTCLRMHSSLEQAGIVAGRVEKELYEGVSTKEIQRLIFKYLKEYVPEVKHQIDLREAISLLSPKPDFETFIGLLLKEYGYSIEMNQIIPGRCIDHEIDVVAKRDNETILVEVKHHLQHHTYTGLGVFLEAQATFEDLVEGFKMGKSKRNFNRLLVVCNTKISDYGKQYANCRGIEHIGWKSPASKGLEKMVEEKKLYPITFLKAIDPAAQAKFGNIGIVTLRQLVRCDVDDVRKKTGISKDRLNIFIDRAKKLLVS